jgi:uncharacterized protein YeaO (DUF488 family)
VKKADYARKNWFDLWLPMLAPSQPLVTFALRGGDFKPYARRYRAEMKRKEPAQLLDLLAALSHSANLAIGCYCEDESRCHRSLLRALLEERGADVR